MTDIGTSEVALFFALCILVVVGLVVYLVAKSHKSSKS